MELRNLKTFLQVVESGSFTRAAELLGYTQAAVSLQISQLESELDCTLFDRIGHKIYLTERGELLFEHARTIWNDVGRLQDAFAVEEMPAGQVHMYTADSICEKMMLLNYTEFFRTYPGIRLIFSTGSTHDLVDVLTRNESDAIFTLDQRICHPNFVIAAEAPVQLCFAAAISCPLASRKTVRIQEILQYPLLLTEHGTSYRKVLDDYLQARSLHADPVLETGRTDIILKYVVQGIGLTFLPRFVLEDEVSKGNLVILPVENMDLTIWKQLIYRKDKWYPKAFQVFLEFVISHEFEW